MRHHITAAAIAAVVAFGIGYLPRHTHDIPVAPDTKASNTHTESAYQRVMRTHTLRCGYTLYAPMLTRDPNTGQMGGIAADVINAVAKDLNIKIEWTAEFGFATAVTDLESGRFDAACIGFWRLPLEAPRLTYTIPFVYSQMNPYTRANETRFDQALDKINDPAVKIISADGQMSSKISTDEFPKAQLVELPNMAPISQQIEEVVAGKADILLDEPGAAEDYMIKNPNKLKKVEISQPLRVYQDTFALKMGENDLKTMLDSALIDVIENGEMDRILGKYDPDKKIFKRVAKGYQQ